MLKKVIIKQQDQSDCGICCIESILKYYDGYVPLEKIKEDSYSSKRGTTAYHIVETLKKYGFDAFGTRIKKETFQKEDIPLPAIVHVVLDNGLNHYMVLYELRKEKVILMDPSNGKKVLSLQDFFWIWSGVIIIAYPKQKLICSSKEDDLFSIMLGFLQNNSPALLRIIIMQLFLSIIMIIQSFFLKLEIQFLNQKTEQIIIFIIFLCILLLQILMEKELRVEERDLHKKLEVNHLYSFIEHVFKLPLNIFKNREFSDYLIRFWEQMDIKYFYTIIGKEGIISIVTFLVCFCFMFYINSSFFLYFLIVSICYLLLHLFFQKRSEYYERSFIEDKGIFSEQLLNMLSNIEMLTLLNVKTKQLEKMEHNLVYFLRKHHQKEKFYQKYSYAQSVIKLIGHFLFVLLGICLLNKQMIEWFDFVLIESIGQYLLNSIETLATILPKWKYLKYIMKKSNSFYTLKTEPLVEEKNKFQTGNLECTNLTFSYNQYNYALKNLNLKIIKGSHILLMGTSGCGKSTLCKLMTRILKADYGEIKVGGVNLEDYPVNTVRSHIAYLSQKSKLMAGTIKENIVMDRPFDRKRFIEVCRACHVSEIADKKPLRYETMISMQENNLSGGEKQRIMLARTLFSDADIFLLDESLSEVDEKIEKEIIKNLKEILLGKTMIYISHKNLKKQFDEVIKLESCNERVSIP